MWKVFTSLNRTAAGSLRSSLREERQSVPILAAAAQLPPSCHSSSTFAVAQNTTSCPCNSYTDSQSLTDSVQPSVVDTCNSQTGQLPARPVYSQTPERSTDAQEALLASARIRPFSVFPESWPTSTLTSLGDGNDNKILVLPGKRPGEKKYRKKEEISSWHLVQLLHYSSLLTVGYTIVHRQESSWHENIVPEATKCPAVLLRHKISVHAQPEEGRTHLPSRVGFEHQKTLANQQVEDLVKTGQEIQNELPFALKAAVAAENQYLDAISTDKAVQLDPVEPATDEVLPQNTTKTTAGCKSVETDQPSGAVIRSAKLQAGTVPAKVTLTAAEQFELELGSVRGIELLQTGDPKGIRLLKRQCLRGSSVAAFYLAMAHERGAASLSVNLARARHYYQLSAARGNAEAKYNLAVFHQQGLGGLPPSESEAGRLLAEAAAEGVVEARQALGLVDPSDLPEEDLSLFQMEDLFTSKKAVEDYGQYLSGLVESNNTADRRQQPRTD